MNNDESFEAEVRETLDGMAREPAPDRLVARVAAIPSQEPAAVASSVRGGPPFHTVISGFAAIAAVLALAVAAVVLRSGEVPGVGTSPSASVPPSSAATQQAVVPTPAISLPPSPTLVPTPVPTNLIDKNVPLGFRPMSVTFVSADQGWVLGSAPCSTGRCPVIAHTLDGGRTWSTIPAPQTPIGTTGQVPRQCEGDRRPAFCRRARWLGLRPRAVGDPRWRDDLEARRSLPRWRHPRAGQFPRDGARGRSTTRSARQTSGSPPPPSGVTRGPSRRSRSPSAADPSRSSSSSCPARPAGSSRTTES